MERLFSEIEQVILILVVRNTQIISNKQILGANLSQPRKKSPCLTDPPLLRTHPAKDKIDVGKLLRLFRANVHEFRRAGIREEFAKVILRRAVGVYAIIFEADYLEIDPVQKFGEPRGIVPAWHVDDGAYVVTFYYLEYHVTQMGYIDTVNHAARDTAERA